MGRRKVFLKGARDGIPVMLGYLAVSFSFGILAVKAGLTEGQSILMSALNLTSAGQFASLSIIAASGGYVELALSQFIINLRYALMSFSLSQKFDRRAHWLHRCAAAFGNTDEIFALASAVKGEVSPWYIYGMMAVAVPGWVTGTALGAIAGNVLPLRVLSALGVALYAMFCAIVVPPAKKNETLLYLILCAMALSLICTVLPGIREMSDGTRVILLTVGISAAAALLRPVKEEQDEA